GESLAERLWRKVEISAFAPVGVRERNGPDRRPHKAAFEPLEELLLTLSNVAHPAVQVDERPNLLVSNCSRGDRVAAIGVADEHDRPGKGPQELRQVGGVAGEIAKRVAEPD